MLIEDNIVEILQTKVNLLNDKHWNTDDCKPIFLVSLLYDKNLRVKEIRQYIILTCQHLSNAFSSVLFPIDENFYGYDSLLKAMNDLYNQTM